MANNILPAFVLLYHFCIIQCRGFNIQDLPEEQLLDKDDMDYNNEPGGKTPTAIERLLAEFKKNLNPAEDDARSEHHLKSDYPGWLDHVWPETELCKDRYNRNDYCLKRRKTNRCWTPGHREHAMTWCANTCGYCNCRNWKDHCCPDQRTRADGPEQKGCPKKLCYDKWVGHCEKMKVIGGCDRSASLREDCAWSCNQCHRLAPSKLCHGRYGCCWDGRPALGPNKKGCRACRDLTPHICSIWGASNCNTGSYTVTWFMQRYCAATCGQCGDCVDKIGSHACRRKVRALNKACDYASIWRDCARYCGACKKKLAEDDSTMELSWTQDLLRSNGRV